MQASPQPPIPGHQVSFTKARATFDEGRLFAGYLDTAAEGFFKFMLGANYVDILATAYLQPNNDLSFEHVTFASMDDKIVGMISGFTAQQHHLASQHVLSDAAGAWNLRFWIVSMLFAPLFRLIDTLPEGDFYLQAIALEGHVRGQGIGSMLLDLAEKTALEKGAVRIALDVSKNNKQAFQLYKKRGYVVESSWPKYLRIPAMMFCRMTKDLAG